MFDRQRQSEEDENGPVLPELFDIHVMEFADRGAAAAVALQQLFALDEATAALLLSQAPVIVKRSATPEVAAALVDVLIPLGAQVVLLPTALSDPAAQVPLTEGNAPAKMSWGGLDGGLPTPARSWPPVQVPSLRPGGSYRQVSLAPELALQPDSLAAPPIAATAEVAPERTSALRASVTSSEAASEKPTLVQMAAPLEEPLSRASETLMQAPAAFETPALPEMFRSQDSAPQAAAPKSATPGAAVDFGLGRELELRSSDEIPLIDPLHEFMDPADQLRATPMRNSSAESEEALSSIELQTIPPQPATRSIARVAQPAQPTLQQIAPAQAKPAARTTRSNPQAPAPQRRSIAHVEPAPAPRRKEEPTQAKEALSRFGNVEPERDVAAWAPAGDLPLIPRAERMALGAAAGVEGTATSVVSARKPGASLQARALAALEFCLAGTVILLGLRFGNSIAYGNATVLWIILHGCALLGLARGFTGVLSLKLPHPAWLLGCIAATAIANYAMRPRLLDDVPAEDRVTASGTLWLGDSNGKHELEVVTVHVIAASLPRLMMPPALVRELWLRSPEDDSGAAPDVELFLDFKTEDGSVIDPHARDIAWLKGRTLPVLPASAAGKQSRVRLPGSEAPVPVTVGHLRIKQARDLPGDPSATQWSIDGVMSITLEDRGSPRTVEGDLNAHLRWE